MKKLTKIVMICGLMMGGVMFASLAQAQSDAAPAKEKAVSVSSVNSAPAVQKKSCCASAAAKSCHGDKAAAMGGNVSETSANAGNAKGGKKAKKAKKSCCASKSAAMGGNVSETSASAGSNAKTKKACDSEKKACCKSKGEKMSSAETK